MQSPVTLRLVGLSFILWFSSENGNGGVSKTENWTSHVTPWERSLRTGDRTLPNRRNISSETLWTVDIYILRRRNWAKVATIEVGLGINLTDVNPIDIFFFSFSPTLNNEGTNGANYNKGKNRREARMRPPLARHSITLCNYTRKKAFYNTVPTLSFGWRGKLRDL